MARTRRRHKRWVWRVRPLTLTAGVVALVLLAGSSIWLLWPFWDMVGQLDDQPSHRPSRLYGAPLTLEVGAPVSLDAVEAALAEAGYRRVAEGRVLPGEYWRGGSSLGAHLRSYPTPRGFTPAHTLRIAAGEGRVRALDLAGREVQRAQLEPPLLASFYGPERKERRPVRLEEMPEDLVLAVLAAEDANFFEHGGVSPSSIARAMWANIRSRSVSQGGSTLTQQLAKNLFLSHDRTVARKSRELVLAVFLDLRYSKREVLEAYLNEIYLGARGRVNLMGVGSASWAYFGKSPAQLTLAEAATLAGIIPAPAHLSPLEHPELARERRDRVLQRLAELEWIEAERLEAARAEPLVVSPQPVAINRAPYFADHARREALVRFGIQELADAGFTVLSTLSPSSQKAAEEAVAWGLESLEDGWEKGREGRSPLQAALVELDPETGAVRAYVGGRDYRQSQFDRAGVGRRQVGSAFKPVVFAAAFRNGAVHPATLLEDRPLTLVSGGRRWSPENADGQYRGPVTARVAMERSLNVPTVRAAMEAGIPVVSELAHRMGAPTSPSPVPSLALGAVELTPVELATIYASLANGGVRPGVHSVVGVLDPFGEPVGGNPPSPPRQVMSPAEAHVVTSLLQGVLDRGTGSGLRRMGLGDPLAGKTGTTNEHRDSWFAGYSPDRVAVVWVGYDENLPTRLGGARAALPIWGRYMARVRPAGGYANFQRPSGVVTAVVDPATGELATDACPEVVTEVFLEGHAPTEVCYLHDRWYSRPLSPGGHMRPREYEDGRFQRWLRRVFGEDGPTDGGQLDRRPQPQAPHPEGSHDAEAGEEHGPF
jgi:penicillin-binding protein 1B